MADRASSTGIRSGEVDERMARVVAATYGPLRPPTLRGVWRVALIVGLIVVGTAAALARTPMRLWNTLWAEDGAIFVFDALSNGPDVIFHGYAGYMHLVPRLAAELAVLLPLSIVPGAVTFTAAILTSLLACACFVFTETRIASVPLRFAAWIACLILPIMGGEVANNLANLHWYLLIAAFCAALVSSRSRSFAVLQAVIIVAAVGSDALALLLLPLMAYRWWVHPHRRDRIPSLAFGVAAVVQIIVVISQLFSSGRPIADARPTVGEFFWAYAIRVALGSLFGVTPSGHFIDAVGAPLPWIALASVIVVLVIASVIDRARRIGIAAFALSSLAFAAIVYSLQWSGFAQAEQLDLFVGSRYTVVPTALLVLAILQAMDAFAARVRRRWVRRTIAAVVLVAVLIPVAIDYRATNLRDGSTAWADSLAQGNRDCAAGDEVEDGLIVVSTAPPWFGGMLMPCAVLERGS